MSSSIYCMMIYVIHVRLCFSAFIQVHARMKNHARLSFSQRLTNGMFILPHVLQCLVCLKTSHHIRGPKNYCNFSLLNFVIFEEQLPQLLQKRLLGSWQERFVATSKYGVKCKIEDVAA